MRAGAALPLSGRYAELARQSAHGLRVWAELHGAELLIEDCGDRDADAGSTALGLAERVDVLFGPYGSGPTRGVAAALAGRQTVIWNHGGAAVARREARVVDVLGPATTYWAGLADVMGGLGVDLDRVAVLHAEGGFGRTVADGAVQSLRAAGHEPLITRGFDQATARTLCAQALDSGAAVIVGCGRWDDDVALGQALAGKDVAVGLVACGVAAAARVFGEALVGWFGPCQWLDDEGEMSRRLGASADYPAAQALAAGLIVDEVLAAAGTSDPQAMWDAVRNLETATFLGPFAVDTQGRQTAHRPLIVRWVDSGSGPVRVPAWRPRPR